ncbi:MAG: hypothetical protein ISS44_00990 [Candidatus Omnitrophica bacterium]|nr:hypothetical protein [Candidatus Omnitrophota bacterium]
MKKNLVTQTCIAGFVFFCFLTRVYGSEVCMHHLSEVLPKAEVIVKGKVDSFVVKGIMLDRGEGLMQRGTECFYTISVEEIMLGNIKAANIKGKYTVMWPDIINKGTEEVVLGYVNRIIVEDILNIYRIDGYLEVNI